MRNYYAAASFVGCFVLILLIMRMEDLDSATNYKKKFRKLLISSTCVCIADSLYGMYISGSFGINSFIFYVIDYTYFTLTMLTNKFWMEYTGVRMHNRKAGDLVASISWTSFILQMILLISNVFTKNAFYVRPDLSVVVGPTRTVIFGLQVLNALLLIVIILFLETNPNPDTRNEKKYNILIAILVIITTVLNWTASDSPMFSLGTMLICLSIYILDITQLLVAKNKKLMSQHKDILREQDLVHESYVQVQRANEAKRSFLAAISHDMRSPMNAIMGMTKIAEANLENQKKVGDCLDTIYGSSQQLLDLINQVLDMNKIESGNLSLHTECISLSEQFSTVIDIVANAIQQKHINFDTSILKLSHDDVFGDAKRIQQCCLILLSNAIKYSPENSKIVFSVRELPCEKEQTGKYEISVRDNGYGITPSNMVMIFDPFFRASEAEIQAESGSGMGLAIVKNLVSMMNGDIAVSSEPGKGSTFTMTIQLALSDEHEILNPKMLQGHTVLIVDTNPVSAESMLYAIEESGLSGEISNSAEDAIRKVTERQQNKTPYSAIIHDWKIPNSDGLETALTLKKFIPADMPLIISSAYDWSDIEDDAAKCKASGFLSKPLEKWQTENTLTTVILGSLTVKQRVTELRDRKLDLAKLRVLLVEDNDLTREIAIELLEMTGMTVHYAINGKEAVSLIENCEDGFYDFVLMDIQMPLLNGYEATKAIRESGRTYAETVPIIAMTANALSEDKIAAQSAGMTDHLAKPLDIPQLIEILKKNL